MITLFRKAVISIFAQCRERGFYFALFMFGSQLVGIMRALFYKLLYVRNLKSTIFSMQANSRIEIFHSKAKAEIGKFVFIRKNASIRLDHGGRLQIKENVFINDNCNINCVHKITIGANTKIASNVCINDHDHNYKDEGEGHLLTGEVVIGDNVWIGANAIVLRNTTIGDNAVIAAGSVVKGIVPADTVFMNKRDNKYVSYRRASGEEAYEKEYLHLSV